MMFTSMQHHHIFDVDDLIADVVFFLMTITSGIFVGKSGSEIASKPGTKGGNALSAHSTQNDIIIVKRWSKAT